MKTKIVIMILSGALLVCGQQKADPAKPSGSTIPAGAAIPAGAERVDAYTYRHTDAKGKTWIYRQTPFGVSKYEDPDTAKVSNSDSQSGVKLPSGAQKVDDSSYRYRDAQGKTWIYSRTPFGFSRAEEVSTMAKQAEMADSNPVKVRDLGDSYEFVKGSPFGQSRWTRKKSELTSEEREMVNQGQAGVAKQETR
ncbi:MAG TPA: hypothetical protein VKG25_16710 [Bryobacteraceae bacterium]|nr:hypothetical protein [Bryobacteraceae bacterium]